MHAAGVDVLEVTAPDKLDRRRRGRIPACNKGMPQDSRSSPADCTADHSDDNRLRADLLRDTLRKMTRMQLIRTLAAWQPDLSGYRNVEEAYRAQIAGTSVSRTP